MPWAWEGFRRRMPGIGSTLKGRGAGDVPQEPRIPARQKECTVNQRFSPGIPGGSIDGCLGMWGQRSRSGASTGSTGATEPEARLAASPRRMGVQAAAASFSAKEQVACFLLPALRISQRRGGCGCRNSPTCGYGRVRDARCRRGDASAVRTVPYRSVANPSLFALQGGGPRRE